MNLTWGVRAMGMSADKLKDVLRLVQRGTLKPPFAIAEMGAQQLRQDLLQDRDLLDAVARAFGSKGPCPLTVQVQANGTEEDDPYSKAMWDWLGCEYLAIDFNGSEHSLPLDLNYDELPKAYRNRYYLVTNFGTTEHVCNQLNAFKAVHDLTAPGGIMMHSVPTQGNCNHGLVNYNLKVFWKLARSNGYRWLNVRYSIGPVEAMPGNIVEEVGRYSPDAAAKLAGCSVRNDGIFIELMKVIDQPFVPPIDMPDGAELPTPEMRRRYRTALPSEQHSRFFSLLASSRELLQKGIKSMR